MTGYGAAYADAKTARIQVEVRGVNQRFLDVKLVLPREYAAFEADLRERIRREVERGRVDVTVTRIAAPQRRRYAVALRTDLARAYVTAARHLARTLDLPGTVDLRDVLHLPDLFEVTETPPQVALERAVLDRAVAAALRRFDRERRREGRMLHQDLATRTRSLAGFARAIGARRPVVVATATARLVERVARLTGLPDLEPGRVIQEVAALVERSDITEELVRLEVHLQALREALRAPGAVGKRVEFLLQEIQREFNTTGAKASDATIAGLVIDGKAEVEKLREQVQNIE